ncbi:MAG TPA: hypothetical protein DCZ94_02090 [Lentisphaeria bacterium]|nr:MAG: hypothetical protein A2X48_22810 [Lentisphaerae bacterium GWF2_49_21]HBC85724.1 hypothetical protein [Lentisphaeria bacterium]
MKDKMTSRERWLAAVRMEPVDRLPFWPKLDGAYPKAQNQPFKEMELDAIHSWIGSDKHNWALGCVKELRKKTSVEQKREGDTRRTIYRTGHGETELVCVFDEPSQSWHPMKFPVQGLDDIHTMIEFYKDIETVPDADNIDKLKKLKAGLGENGVLSSSVGESPMMYWVEWLAGVENAHFLLADHQDDVEELFSVMQKKLSGSTRITCEQSPVDLLYLTENTSTTLISPDQYRKYCSVQVGECAKIAKDAGRNMVLHMCGHLKAILPDLAKIPVRAFEAFTSPTLGNTTLLDGRTNCPDKCLIGGTNAMLWTKNSSEIIKQIEKDLCSLPHHRGIVVTSAGVMPPLCKPETIREVCEWVKTYPVRN